MQVYKKVILVKNDKKTGFIVKKTTCFLKFYYFVSCILGNSTIFQIILSH
jgi:hypothetical protein